MRTNIDIDDTLMDAALRAGPYTTKRDAVEAGLKLLARQAAYREILKWEGKLKWDGEPWSDHVLPAAALGPSSKGRRARRAATVQKSPPAGGRQMQR